MRALKIVPILALLSLALPACQSRAAVPAAVPTRMAEAAPQETSTEIPASPKAEPGLTASPAGTARPVRTAVPALSPSAPEVENAQYDLSATLDYDRHHLAVEERITYPNRAGEPIPDLLLVVEPTRYPEVFRLKSLDWGDGRAIEDYSLSVGQLRIPLEEPLAPGESVRFSLAYEMNLPSPSPSYYGRPVPFGYSARQTNLVDWYPFLPPYIPGQGWLARQAGYFGEHLAYETADFQVDIRLAGAREDLTIAASAPAEREAGEYLYRLPNARNFAWSVSDQYQVSMLRVGQVTVLGYAFPAHAQAGQAALEATASALELYSELFGAYPHSTLAVVEADFLDGMEFDGLYFLSKGFYNLFSDTPADYLTAIAAHETAHQWWYGLVGNDQAEEPWLDEALATYSERLFYERIHPEALDWWWAYRVNYYQPAGDVGGSIYNPEGYRAYRDAVYLNGALFLEDLRDLAGEEAFLLFLREYAAANAGRIATGEDFFALLGQHTDADISPLFAKYFGN